MAGAALAAEGRTAAMRAGGLTARRAMGAAVAAEGRSVAMWAAV